MQGRTSYFSCRSAWIALSLLTLLSFSVAYADSVQEHFNKGFHLYESWVQNHQTDDLDQALKEMQAAHREAPKSPVILQWIGFLQIARADYADAIDPLQQAILLDPKQGLPYVDLGFAYHKLGLYPDAAEALQHAIAIYGAMPKPDVRDPYLYRCYFDLGTVYFDAATKAQNSAQKSELLKNAIAAYQKAASLPPSASVTAPTGIPSLSPQSLDRPALYIALASASLKAGDLTLAADSARQATQLAPDREAAWRLLGFIQMKAADQSKNANALSEAQTSFEKALSINPKDYEAREGLGRIYLVQNRYQEAYEAFQQAAADRQAAGQQAALPPDMLYNSAVAAQKVGKIEEAIHLFQTYLQTAPNDASALAWLGACYLQQHQYDQAVATLHQALEISPSDTTARLNLASALVAQKQYVPAAKELQELAQKEPNSPLVAYLLGTTLANTGDYTAAVDSLERYAQLDPQGKAVPNGDGFCALGDALQHLGRNEEAIAAYRKATQIAASNALAWHNLGILTLQEALQKKLPISAPEWQTAQTALDNAVRLNPDDYAALEAQATLLAQEGNATAAVEKLQAALKLHPNSIPALLLLAKTQTQLGLYAAADSAYQQALSRDPQNVDIALLYAQNLLHQQEYSKAAQVLAPLYTANSSHLQLALFYARSLQLAGQKQEAMEVLQKTVTLPRHGPEMALGLRMLGYLLVTSGERKNWQQAEEIYRRALVEQPNSAEALNGLGLAILKLGQPKAAIAYFKKAITMDPSYVDAVNNIGVAREQLGDIPGALSAFRRALQIDPQNQVAQENLQRYRGWIKVFENGSSS